MKMRMFCAVVLVAMIAGSASAGVVAEFNSTVIVGEEETQIWSQWPEDGDGNALPVEATTWDSTLLAAAPQFALGPDLAKRGNVANMALATRGSNNDPSDYWTLNLTPGAAGVKLTGVSFNVRTNSDPDQWIFSLYSSETGGAPTASNQEAGRLAMVTIDTADANTATLSASLDEADFGNLTDPVTFYLQISAVVGDGQYSEYDFFGFQEGVVASVEGEVVPEPATLSLLGLGGLVALRRRRRA